MGMSFGILYQGTFGLDFLELLEAGFGGRGDCFFLCNGNTTVAVCRINSFVQVLKHHPNAPFNFIHYLLIKKKIKLKFNFD